MSIRVNTVSIGASATSASAYSATIPGGTGIIAGDLIIVNALSNGTHVLNGITCQDNVNVTNFTQIKEQLITGAYFQQTFFFVTPANIADGSLITLTPYAAATDTCFSVDIYRYALGTITNAVVAQTNTASVNQAAPALAAAPLIGNLVFTFDCAASTGTLTPGAAFALQSSTSGTASRAATGYASASGSSTFASTWVDGTSCISATQTVALQNAGVGVPYKIGQDFRASGASATQTVTTTVSSNANDALFVILGTSGNTITPGTPTDSGAHTWTQVASYSAPNGMTNYVYQSLNAAALGSGGTVTVVWSGTNSGKNMEVIACAGVNHTTALDQTATGAGSGKSPTATTMNLANNNELALGVITSGYLSAGITWASPTVAMDTGLRAAGSIYTSVGTQVITNSTAPVQMGATLGASAVWAELIVTLLPDPPTGAPATVTITAPVGTTLPAGVVGTAYSFQMMASGGSPPYTWSVTAGSMPAGINNPEVGGGSSNADISFVGANTGPQGAPTLAGFTGQYASIGPIGYVKIFYSATGFYGGFLGGDVNGGGTTGFTNGLEGQITAWCQANNHPIPLFIVCWNAIMSQTAITNYCSHIPAAVKEVGFSLQSEPENNYALTGSGGVGSGASGGPGAWQADWSDQALKVQNARATTTTKLTLIPTHFMGHYQDGTLSDGRFIPPTHLVDVYGIDLYDRFNFWGGSANLGGITAWTVWTGLVKGFGKQLGIAEYGISGSQASPPMTAAQQLSRLQADYAYIKTAFGSNPGGTLSQLPLYCWLYWNTDDSSHTQTGNKNQLMTTAADAVWAGISAAQGGISTGGTGGLITGTPTTVVTNQAVTIRATDTNAAFGFKALTMSTTASAALGIDTTSPLSGGTINVPYTTLLSAHGGTLPYTWSITSGALPTGLAISGQTITGTPTAGGTFTFNLKVTDNVAANVTLTSAQITISTSLSVSTTSLPAGMVGSAYSASIVAIGGTPPYNYQLVSGVIPDGLTFTPATGGIAGTPTTAGTPSLQFQAIDDALATALSNVMVMSIAPLVTGGMPQIGRRRFGGGESDWVFAFSGVNLIKQSSINLTFWSALTGGSQYTDLLTYPGGIAITSVTTDTNGNIPEFQGPSGIFRMASDANAGAGPRVWLYATDIGDEATKLDNFLRPLTG